jgi:Kef-type K+ transport system membrane component KefB
MGWIDKLSDEATRTALGRRFEAVTDEVFTVVRWAVVVGLARYLSLQSASIWYDILHWAMSAMLLGYLASRFLLRPEVPIFARRDRRWKRILQTVVNIVACMLAFMAVMMLLDRLVDGLMQYRIAPMPQ